MTTITAAISASGIVPHRRLGHGPSPPADRPTSPASPRAIRCSMIATSPSMIRRQTMWMSGTPKATSEAMRMMAAWSGGPASRMMAGGVVGISLVRAPGDLACAIIPGRVIGVWVSAASTGAGMGALTSAAGAAGGGVQAGTGRPAHFARPPTATGLAHEPRPCVRMPNSRISSMLTISTARAQIATGCCRSPSAALPAARHPLVEPPRQNRCPILDGT